MNGYKVLLLSLLLLLVSTVAHAKIVFSSERDGVQGIYVMDDDGSNQTLLTESEELSPYPNRWSPDGQQILFKRRPHVNAWHVFFLMNVDGTNVRQLTKNDASTINSGSFSPDSKSIVFNRSTHKLNVWKDGTVVLNIETGELEEISDFWGIQHDWSPDGEHIICAEPRTLGVHNTIWIMDADGHNNRPLIPAPAEGGEFTIHRKKPRWSPDGKQIVFLQMEYKTVIVPNVGESPFFKAFRYIICDRNGENIRQLRVPKDMESLSVAWMDEGESIVFTARGAIPLNKVLPRDFDFPPANIYKYHISTGEITRLTDHPGKDMTLDWISDDVLSVSSKDKKKVVWGTLK